MFKEYRSCPSKDVNKKQQVSFLMSEACRRAVEICMQLKKHGVHLPAAMKVAGFTYTATDDTARCKKCGLEVSKWTVDMIPLAVHTERSPTCPFIRSITLSTNLPSTTTSDRDISSSDDQENPSKRRKIESGTDGNALFEADMLKQVRCRTFSHWLHRTTPSQAQMIQAGFFNCNVGDRVICLYCNLICQQWTPHTDDPYEVHKTLSPQCPYIRLMDLRRQASSVLILNENATNHADARSASSNAFRSNEIVLTSACHTAYTTIPRRHASFATWPEEPLPSVDDLVRAGFFYTGARTVTTCFYCNGSLQNWGPKDDPTVEHARWFPHCAYVKQLCGDELYRKIQESKRVTQERAKVKQSKENENSTAATNSSLLQISDESTLSRLVAARLDLTISQSLLDRDFKLSIIKRCWEDQLRLKQDDFVDDCDLLIACIILQKQIDYINGNKENIIVPSVKMRMIRERQANAASSSFVSTVGISLPKVSSNGPDMKTSTPSRAFIESKAVETKTENKTSHAASSSSANLCVVCFKEEKHLACIPCGHLTTCVACGYSLRTCPVCRKEIEAFVRIYT